MPGRRTVTSSPLVNNRFSILARPRVQELRASAATPIDVTYSTLATALARQAATMLPTPASSTSMKSWPACLAGCGDTVCTQTMTARTCCAAADTVWASSMSPRTTSTRSPARSPARVGSRTRDRTGNPAAVNSLTTRRPTKPVAPITNTARSSPINVTVSTSS